jgi:hypothetical protein
MSYDSGMGERIKRHSGWRWPVLIALGIALFGAMFLLFYLGPTPGDITGVNPKFTAESTPVQLTVQNTSFVIPANFIQLPKMREGGQQEAVEMQALLPDLMPYSADQAEAFADTTASSKILSMDLRPTKVALTEEQRLQRVYFTKTKDREGIRADNGLTSYEFQEESGYDNQLLYVGQDSRGGTAVLLCEKPSSEVTAPECWRDVDVAGGLVLKYRFKRGFLPKWKDIDRRAVELIGSFRAASS